MSSYKKDNRSILKRILFIVNTLVILYNYSYSQDSVLLFDYPIVGLHYMRGNMSMPDSYNAPESGVSNYIDINMLWQTTGSKDWHQNYLYPEMGIGFIHGDLGNDSVYGQLTALYPTWIIKSRKDKKIGVDFKMGLGFAYFNKPYDRLSNLSNEVIGSTITNFTKVGFGLRYSPINQLSLYAGIDFIHCSNGHTRIPNYGLNDRTYSLGARYSINQTPKLKFTPKEKEDYKIRYNLRLGFGVHEYAETRSAVGGPKYPIYNLTGFLSRRFSKINEVHLGVGATYYVSYYDYLKANDLFVGDERKYSTVLNAMLGHEFLIARFGFVTEYNLNFYTPYYYKVKRPIEEQYHEEVSKIHYMGVRLGFQYYPLKSTYDTGQNLSIGLFLKTIVEKADFVEINLTYSF